MSVPVRYSAAPVNLDNNNCASDRSVAKAEMRKQRISQEGRFGTPDAAGEPNLNYVDQQHIQTQPQLHQQQQQPQQSNLPTPSSEELFAQLNEALALEKKYETNLILPSESQKGEITVGARDGAAHVLRCLKVLYGLPSDVLFAAINLVDRFLAKMRVKTKHMACISVGSFYLAINQLGFPKVDTEELVAISQCRCTSGDLERMANIIANKLGVQMAMAPVTSLTCLRLFYYIFKNAANDFGLGEFFDNTMSLQDLETQLEILTCDASCAGIGASQLALVLICTQFDSNVTKLGTINSQIQGLIDYIAEMQQFCKITEVQFFQTHNIVVHILSRYNAQQKMPYKQRLVWKLSMRTMRVLRPTDKLTFHLPTIKEHNTTAMNNNLSRFRTGSVSSEEGEDWPTSPVMPVYEQC